MRRTLDIAEPAVARRCPPQQRPATRISSWGLAAIVAVGVALRAARLGVNQLTFDESFTAMAGRRSVGSLLGFLGTHDSHPPLDYLMRVPLARAGAADWTMRLPSLAISAAALVVFALWMHTYGRAGALALALMAFSGLQIRHGSEARMYALMALVGVVAAALSDAWLQEPRRWHRWALSCTMLAGLFTHVSALLLAAGLLLLPLSRPDTEAWRWRLAVALPIGAWLLVWGPSFVGQSHGNHASWIPRTSAASLVEAIATQVTPVHFVGVLLVVGMGVGGLVTVRRWPRLGRVWLLCGVVPIALAAAVGVLHPFLLARTILVVGWAPLIALGAALDGALARSRLIGTTICLLTAGLVLLGASWLFTKPYESDRSMEHLASAAGPGDVVAVRPAWYQPIVSWNVGVRSGGRVEPVELRSIPEAAAFALDRPRSGRVWLLVFSGDAERFSAYRRCAPDWSDGETAVLCIQGEEVLDGIARGITEARTQ